VGSDALQLGSDGRYDSCLLAGKTVDPLSYLSALEAAFTKQNTMQTF